MDKEQINSPGNLKSAILDLERARSEEESTLKEQFNLAYESVKPINLITSTFNEAVASTEVKRSLLSISLGLASVYFSKKILEKRSNNSVAKIAGTIILFGLTNILARHPEIITNLADKLMDKLRKKEDEPMEVIDLEPGQFQQVP